MDGHLYEMQAEKILLGNVGKHFKVWEENSSGRASFDWEPGRSYLLFLLRKEDRGWVLEGCGNSGPLEKKQSALQEIEALRRRQGGMIQVAIGGGVFASWSPAVSNASVTAQGTNGTFSATTNDKGIADIHVPAGQYTAAVDANEAFEPYFMSYEQPKHLEIQNGGCAQIQFVAAKQGR